MFWRLVEMYDSSLQVQAVSKSTTVTEPWSPTMNSNQGLWNLYILHIYIQQNNWTRFKKTCSLESESVVLSYKFERNVAGKSRWCDFQTYVKLAQWIFSVNELPAAVNLNGVVLWVLLLGRSEHGGLLSQGVPFQNHWQVLWILLENEGLLQRKMWNALTRGSKTLTFCP